MAPKAVLLGLAGAVLAASGGEERPAGVEFRLQYLPVHGRRADTMTYDFDGDGRGDVFNSSVNFDADPPERWAALHLQREGGYSETPDFLWPLSDRACALVFGDFLPGGGVEVGFIAEDGVYAYPWNRDGPSETPLKLIHARTFYRSPSLRQISTWQWASDLDRNGRHDLVLPVEDGYRVYFQTAPGVFGRVAVLEADLAAGAPRVLGAGRYAETVEVSPSLFVSGAELPRLEAVDINGDGLSDLVLVRGDTITYFLQKEPGVFPSQRPYRIAYAVPTLRDEPRKDSVNLSLIRFVDIDRDGMADLVVTKIQGTLGLWESIRTSVYLHLGTGKGNFLPDRRIVIDGVSIDPEFVDMDLDGRLDCVTSRLRTDLMKKAVEAFVLGDVPITYEVFQFDAERRTFLPDPVYEKQILVRRNDLEKAGAGAVPLVFVRGDLSGDGRPDLVEVDPKAVELRIHPGVVRETPAGRRIGFDKTAHWAVPLERAPKSLHLLDVNSDGLNDILLYHAGALGLVLSRRR